MKLLLVSVKSDDPQGGIAVWTERFLSRCEQLNIQCSLVNMNLTADRIRTGKRNFWSETYRTHRIFGNLKRCLKAETFDVAYLNTPCGTFGLFRDYWIARKIRKKKIPIVTQYHCDIPYWVRKSASWRFLGKLAAISAHNFVLCQNSKNFLQEQYGITSVKVPNFLETNAVLTKDKVIHSQVKNIAFVGRVTQAKGAEELFAVARQLPDIRFTFIGAIGSLVSQWEKPPNVTLTGAVPHEKILGLLDRADIFLLPSHTEGCSIALMEAMARGIPAIATNTGANADMLGGGCGIIVAKHDTDAMVAAIHALAPRHIRKELSRNALKKASENYTEKNVDQIIALVARIQKDEKERAL